jgi:hypothetical protein
MQVLSKIDINQLRSFLNSVLDHVQDDLNISSVNIDSRHNFFWEVPLDELFEISGEPPRLVMGSSVDSLEFVSTSINAGAKESYAATLMLMHAIPLLQVICHKIRA